MITIKSEQLEKASEEAKMALRALRQHGHPESCSCKLCYSGRTLANAFARLVVADVNRGNGDGAKAK